MLGLLGMALRKWQDPGYERMTAQLLNWHLKEKKMQEARGLSRRSRIITFTVSR